MHLFLLKRSMPFKKFMKPPSEISFFMKLQQESLIIEALRELD